MPETLVQLSSEYKGYFKGIIRPSAEQLPNDGDWCHWTNGEGTVAVFFNSAGTIWMESMEMNEW